MIPPTRQALAEALELSGEILRNLELSELSLANIALKTSRLARLLNDVDELKKYSSLQAISKWEEQVRTTESALSAARDPDGVPLPKFAISSANSMERLSIRLSAQQASAMLAGWRAQIYAYASRKHYELKFSGIADDVFTRIRERVDSVIGKTIPDCVRKLVAAYENLRSENPEDWSNAVHSCRRILQDLADAVFPATDEVRTVIERGKTTKVKLGKENYVNRIIAFVQDKSDSERFEDLVGSHLRFVGNRLDAVYAAGSKGTHTTIADTREADRYVVYTYLLVGDVLSLVAPSVGTGEAPPLTEGDSSLCSG